MRRRTTLALGLALGLAATSSAAFAAPEAKAADKASKAGKTEKANTLTAAEKKAGWKLLFDGKSTAGWKGYKKDQAPGSWSAVDGTLLFQKTDGQRGDLMTVEQFDDFELSLEWKISAGGNSGVIYRVAETEDAPWKTGPEMQVLDNTAHKDGKNPLTSAASFYAMYPPAKDVTKPVGEWNVAKLVVAGNHVEHWLNGEKVVDLEIGSPDWNSKFEASKFAKYKDFGRMPKGHLVLQDHGDPIAFRNVKLRSLAPAMAKSEKAPKK